MQAIRDGWDVYEVGVEGRGEGALLVLDNGIDIEEHA